MKPLAVEPSVFGHMGHSVEMLMWLWQDWGGEEANVLQRRADPKENEAQTVCCTGVLFHTREENQACPGPVLQKDQPISQHTLSMRVAHTHIM